VSRKEAEIALADEILTVSEYARESYLDAGISADRVHACAVGVDTQRFQPSLTTTATQDSGPLRFVYVGHIENRKGADVLLDAAAQLQCAGTACSVTLIGKNRSELELAAEKGVEHRGWMSQKDLAAELPRYHVLILPSRHDSFGMVVAEAMACGLPVIVSDQVGSKELVKDRQNGIVVTAGDAACLANAMRWFVDHRSQLPEMSRAARISAERYDWQEYRKRIVQFFQLAPTQC
jgi:glycosyltransferase involved in cell wall biosynthesis